MSMWSFFAYISELLRLVWVYSFGRFFSKKWSVDSQPCDIEAGIPSTPVSVPVVVPVVHEVVDLEAVYIEPIPNPFLDRHASMSSKNPGRPVDDQEFECPVRRPSRRHSMIVPLKSRIVDATCRNIQDISLEKVKAVTVTCGPVVAVECSAQIEYYFDGHIASTANVEWFDPALDQACSAEVEYFGAGVAETVGESSFSGSSDSAGFSSIDASSMENGCDSPLAGSLSVASCEAQQDWVIGNASEAIPFASASELATALPCAEDVEVETSSGLNVLMATPSLDSVAGRAPIQSGLKYSHRRYSTCISSMDNMETATNTSDIGVETVQSSSRPSSRARIQNGVKYSHRRYTWNSFEEGSSSGSVSLPGAWDSETASIDSSAAAPFSGSPEVHTPANFVLDGKDFVEDSAEWSSQCVNAMDAVRIDVESVAGEADPVPAVVESSEDRIKRISRESTERFESLRAQMEARFEAAFKEIGLPWIPTKELRKSLESN